MQHAALCGYKELFQKRFLQLATKQAWNARWALFLLQLIPDPFVLAKTLDT